jgi:peptide/nickel transport system ATP-binding protein
MAEPLVSTQDLRVAFRPRHASLFGRGELRIHRIGRPDQYRERIAEALRLVGMDPNFVSRHPRQFSGGQLQRLGLARALILGANVLLADEPVSALDVSIQAQVLNLFQDLKERLGLTYIVIAHDLAAVRYLCDRVAVMFRGRFVEVGRTEDLYARPAHPYTQALLSAIPTIHRGVAGDRLAEVDSASLFLGRGELKEIEPGHFVEAA